MIKKNVDDKFNFMNHQIEIFVVLKLKISFSYVFFSSFPTVIQMSNALNINMQFIITCFDVCSSTSHKQFEWSKSDILRSCKNFVSLIFLVYICVIRLYFVFIRSVCHFIFFCLMNLSASTSILIMVVDKSFNEMFSHL